MDALPPIFHTAMSKNSATIQILSHTAILFALNWLNPALADEAPCATLNVERLLNDSQAANKARAKMEAEFKGREVEFDKLASARNQAERALLDAKKAGKPEEEVKALQAQFDNAAKVERDTGKPLQQAMIRRRQEELTLLQNKTMALIKQIADAGGYKMVFQAGEKDPVLVLDKKLKPRDCTTQIDITAQIMAGLDQAAPVQEKK